jgi:hypothetical protein
MQYRDFYSMLIPDGYPSALFSSDSSCLPEVCMGTPFCPLMGLRAPPPFEKCIILDVDRSLGFRRDFSVRGISSLT